MAYYNFSRISIHWFKAGESELSNANNEKDNNEQRCFYFDAFINFWISFNAIYASFSDNARKTEREQIEGFLENENCLRNFDFIKNQSIIFSKYLK